MQPKTPRTPAAGIILAAGDSRRFGRPKQLAPFGGRPLLEWVLEAALGSDLDRVVLVLGGDQAAIQAALGAAARHDRLEVVSNPDPRAGQSASLRAGLLRVHAACPVAMFLLADQPLVDAGLINRVIAGLRGTRRNICVPVHRGLRGNPTAFTRLFYPQLLGISGDKGAREVIAANPDEVLAVEVEDPDLFADVDTPADLARLEALRFGPPVGP
jgi:molybdenum cofactor cytidylyltransferase